MTVIQYVCAGAAVVVAAWPQIISAVQYFFSDDPSVPAPRPLAQVVSPNYQTAIAHLASVRLRLLHTDCLNEDQKKAIDVLTLALVDGSDQ